MIKNEREYKITKASLSKFEQALSVLSKHQDKTPKDLAKLKLQEAATKSMISDLQEQIQEYEELRAGRFDLGALDMVEAIPSSLICARIALGWTQPNSKYKNMKQPIMNRQVFARLVRLSRC
jgi:hypothetical protein